MTETWNDTAKQIIAIVKKFQHLFSKTNTFLMVRYYLHVVRLRRERHFEMMYLFDISLVD